MKGIKKILKYLGFYIPLVLLLSIFWGKANFQIKSFNQVLYTLTNPMSGASDGVFITWLLTVLVPATILTLIIYWLSQHKESKIGIWFKKHYKRVNTTIVLVVLVVALVVYRVPSYAVNKIMTTDLYEGYYVDPKEQEFKFPTHKKNLIYIYLESMETTFSSNKEIELSNGKSVQGTGYQEINLIPELTELAYEHISFSNNEGLGGAFMASDTGWTTAAMLAQTSGVTLKPSVTSTAPDVAPGAYTLGEILEKEGYNQTLMIGSEAVFGGRDTYFKNHGNYKIFDLNSAKDIGLLPNDYHTWWGFEDSKLFEYAKLELNELSNKEEPFNLTLLTVNTHNPDGFVEESCKANSEIQMFNSISCSSKQVDEFVRWAQTQSWFDDTLIVLSGDHLSMNTSYMDKVDTDKFDRRTYNVFMNATYENNNLSTKNRQFSSLDMFPTTLSAMGVSWDGDRLGLGTNLFSSEKTLPELMGVEEFNKELSKRSEYYDEFISGKNRRE